MRLSVKKVCSMTAVMDIPDELYQKVTDRVALLGRRVPEVTAELYERWLGDSTTGGAPISSQPSGEQWLEDWFCSADEAIAHAAAGQSARDLLLQDRNRLEKL